ncbi:MAG: hypothetical protein GC179_19380 [Anaerolineaceae bacterium]|nr:hypothetical protein [Anaerolineaceae bacterium]
MPSRSEDKPSVQIKTVDVTADVEFLREGLRVLVQVFIELEISEVIEANPHERSSNRRSYRNGYRRRTWMTSLGELMLEIPKLRKGTYYPAFLDALRESESFLIDSLKRIHRNGVSVSEVEKIVDKMGFDAVQPSQIADITEQLYDLVDRFSDRPRMHLPENLTLYHPVSAISTRTIDTHISGESNLPKSLYTAYPDDWLTESLATLIRVHRAMSDELDAVAV